MPENTWNAKGGTWGARLHQSAASTAIATPSKPHEGHTWQNSVARSFLKLWIQRPCSFPVSMSTLSGTIPSLQEMEMMRKFKRKSPFMSMINGSVFGTRKRQGMGSIRPQIRLELTKVCNNFKYESGEERQNMSIANAYGQQLTMCEEPQQFNCEERMVCHFDLSVFLWFKLIGRKQEVQIRK